MKLNVFEGARRIAMALGALWVVGCIAYAVFAEPYASATFAIPGPGEPPVQAERCADDDATAYTTAKTSKGHNIGISLCFTAHTAEDGRRLVPPSSTPKLRKYLISFISKIKRSTTNSMSNIFCGWLGQLQ